LVEPIQVITAAIDAVQPSADTKAIQLESVLEPRIARFGDPERLQQVVWIYFSNAIKFTLLEGAWKSDLNVDSQVQIAVSDTGKASVPIFCRMFRPLPSS